MAVPVYIYLLFCKFSSSCCVQEATSATGEDGMANESLRNGSISEGMDVERGSCRAGSPREDQAMRTAGELQLHSP